jgi:parallel beta-helix repeat protein
LGYNASEAYGLSWKVLGSGLERFDVVEVRGDVENSHLHHNYFGGYTYGALAMRWVNNEIDHNVVYGFDPHDDSDQLLIEGNHVHHNGKHGIICSKRCDHLTIRNNTVNDNGGNGIMLHREITDSLIEGNETFNHPDGGIALLEGHRNVIRGNTSRNNKYGIRLSVGSEDNTLAGNSVLNNTSYGIYFYKGSDAPTAGDGRPKNNEVTDNTISGNTGGGLKLVESDQNVFLHNQFTGNGGDLRLDKSHNNRLEGNTVSGNPSYGIRLEPGSVGNQILSNTIDSNGKVGVYTTPLITR